MSGAQVDVCIWDYQQGGKNSHLKAKKLIDEIRYWFTQSNGKNHLIPVYNSNLFYSDSIHCSFPEPLHIDDLKTLIYEGMVAAFDLKICDGSIGDVCCETVHDYAMLEGRQINASNRDLSYSPTQSKLAMIMSLPAQEAATYSAQAFSEVKAILEEVEEATEEDVSNDQKEEESLSAEGKESLLCGMLSQKFKRVAP
ncbi:Pre-rRNA-processing protein TSR2, motif protein, putative [Medicago truncatula]|uniref:Pre-rRNA-processing protein TSR2, motif protein, putative n=1 Tax=Medicago truncatula TaxID=3880 RepID=G7LID9_MEDTR|nr:Pre-rRNA-processing protein TSR2, motif protein, putative [Medicago truncatula]